MANRAQNDGRSLEAQFVRPEFFSFSGTRIGVYDISPKALKTEIPVMLGVGWSMRPRNYREIMIELARKGRRVICVDAPHGVEASPSVYPRVELGKANVLMEVLARKDISRVDALAHSEAALYTTIAATLHPEKFRSIVFVNAAGIIGKDNMWRLITGFSSDLAVEFVYALRAKIARGLVKGLGMGHTMKPSDTSLRGATSFGKSIKTLRKGLVQSAASMHAIAHADIRKILENLREKGIGLAFIHAVGDRTFPIKRVRKIVNGRIADAFYEAPGTHQSVTLNPVPYASLIDQALDELEKRTPARADG